jgi:hypothetical protein
MERAILDNALINLERNIGLKAKWELYGHKKDNVIDAKLTFRLDNKKRINRFAEVKKEIRKHHVPGLKATAQKYGTFMLVVERIYPQIKLLLNEAGVDWMDAAGNIHLKEKETYIWVDRHTTTPVKEKKNRAFTKTGLKVVFLFIHDEQWLNRTYREIAEMAGVALGNIKHVYDGLKEHRFILAVDDKNLKLVNKDELLFQWMTAFTDELKPKILKGYYRFRNEDIGRNWKNLDLCEGTVWGGEPAADILTNDLKPMRFTLYTPRNRADIMKRYDLIPDGNGNVEVLEPYWNIEPEKESLAPFLTIYTDLMTTGDPRNTKIAKKIYNSIMDNNN